MKITGGKVVDVLGNKGRVSRGYKARQSRGSEGKRGLVIEGGESRGN